MENKQQNRYGQLKRVGMMSLVLSVIPFSTATASEPGVLDDPFVSLEVVSDVPVTQSVMRVDKELLRRAEASYQRGRFEIARDQFGLIAAMNNYPFAWLRIGNIWHRQGRSSMAIDAYSRARQSAGAVDGHQGIAQRAQKNLALLGLALTDRSLRAIGAGAVGSGADRWTIEVRRRLVRLEASLPTAPVLTAEPIGQTPGQANMRQKPAGAKWSTRPARVAPSGRAGAGS